MKIGISAFAWTTNFDSRHFHLLPRLHEHGIAAIELPMFDPAVVPASSVRKACESNSLEITICAILPPGINPISPDAATRQRSFEHLVSCIDTAEEMGAKLIAGPTYAPIGYLPGRRRTAEEWAWAIDCFERLGPILTKAGVTLAIEPVNRGETFFLTTALEAKEFCAKLDHPLIGVTLDTFHANIEEKDIASSIRLLGPALKHLHASENDRGLLGTGHVDFPEIVASLRTIGYDGYLMVEGFGYSPEEPDARAALWKDQTASADEVAFGSASFLAQL